MLSKSKSIMSIIYFNTKRKQHKCFFYKNKNAIIILKVLWMQNLIWGYIVCNNVIKVYLKYYLTRSVIQEVKMYKFKVNLQKLKWITKNKPQSIFMLKTIKGYKTNFYCLKHNIGGILIIQIN
jgi:ribosomal protein S8